MINFSNGPLVTPERIVILSIFCVGISGSGEDLVPERGIAIRVGSAVRRLSAGEQRERRVVSGLRPLLGPSPPSLTQHRAEPHMWKEEIRDV